jgi:glycosyltransferase involved in cell wall biosynthesis
MRIDLYTISWNDIVMLPHFLRHYESWVDRIIVFDDHSDDGTREMLAAHPKVELRDLPAKGNSFVLTALNIWNHAWKESRDRADWVVVTNIDEFFVHPLGERGYLESIHRTHHTMVHPLGFEMYGDAFPTGDALLVDALPHGVPRGQHDKMQLFNPNAITEMRYLPGRHLAKPQGRVKIAQDGDARLLHYKHVDTEGYFLPRQAILGSRMLPGDIANHFGFHYHVASDDKRRAAAWIKRHALNVRTTAFGA